MKILLIDNYDSFTYNLFHYAEQVTEHEIVVVRNDEISIEDVELFDKIMLSPGPGLPKDAGITMEVIRRYADSKSILGICLGHQAIGEAFGGQLHNLSEVQHGVATPIEILKPDYLYAGIPSNFVVGRYHSWVIDKNNFPKELEIIATDMDGAIMSCRHKTLDVRGVQFHPESIMTEFGLEIIRNWIQQPILKQ